MNKTGEDRPKLGAAWEMEIRECLQAWIQNKMSHLI